MVLKLHGKPGAEAVHIRRPQVRNDIHQRDPNRYADCENHWSTSREPRREHILSFLILGNHPRLTGDVGVEHPAKDSTKQGAVREVDGETVAAEPEEEAV